VSVFKLMVLSEDRRRKTKDIYKRDSESYASLCHWICNTINAGIGN